MRAPHFRIRNKHLRTDFLAYPMKRRKTWTIPHEYWILGVTTDEKVAHVGKIWNEDEFPIIVRRSLNSKQRMYGVVFEEPLRMFQKLNLLGLAFAIKFLRRDFDPPPPFVKTDRKMIIPAVPITSSEGKEWGSHAKFDLFTKFKVKSKRYSRTRTGRASTCYRRNRYRYSFILLFHQNLLCMKVKVMSLQRDKPHLQLLLIGEGRFIFVGYLW